MPKATGKLMYWRSRLSELKFDIAHSVEVEHPAADVLSRLKNKS